MVERQEDGVNPLHSGLGKPGFELPPIVIQQKDYHSVAGRPFWVRDSRG